MYGANKLLREMNEAQGIYESELPPGFSEDDVESVEEFIQDQIRAGKAKPVSKNDVTDGNVPIPADGDAEEGISEAYSMLDEALGIDDANISTMPDAEVAELAAAMMNYQNMSQSQKTKLRNIAKKVNSGEVTPEERSVYNKIFAGSTSEQLSKLLHPSNYKTVADDSVGKKYRKELDPTTGKKTNIPNPKYKERDLTLDELKRDISVRPKALIGQNKKLATSGKNANQVFFDSTLPSYQGIFVDESTGEFKIVRTCPSAGACKAFCYASKGNYVIFKNSSMLSSRVVNYLMNDPQGFQDQMIREIKAVASPGNRSKLKGKEIVLRWHDSGDFLSEKYLLLAYAVAKATPDVLHYAYTKQIPMVRKLASEKPDNFEFVFSVGGLFDADIDTKTEKHSQVVPLGLFNDLSKIEWTEDENGKKQMVSVKIDPDKIPELKQVTADHYKVPVDSVITYDELVKIQPPGNERKWHVLVWKGHGDDAAARKDVLGVWLLFH